MSQQSKIYVGNLSYDATEQDLEKAFAQYGHITEINAIKDRATGRSKGFAFITFEIQKEAEAALKANDVKLLGRNMRVNMATDKPRGGYR